MSESSGSELTVKTITLTYTVRPIKDDTLSRFFSQLKMYIYGSPDPCICDGTRASISITSTICTCARTVLFAELFNANGKI